MRKIRTFKNGVIELLLIVGLMMNLLPLSCASAEKFIYQERYLRDAVYRSCIDYEGIHGMFLDIDDLNTIHTEIRFLDLHDLNITELPDLSEFKALEILLLDDNPIQDISALDGNTKLTSLSIKNTKIEKIPSLPSLIDFHVENTSLDDISFLKNNAPQMTGLGLVNTAIQDFSVTADMHSLMDLEIGNTDRPLNDSELQLIRNNDSITRLRLVCSDYGDISSIAKMNGLTKLLIEGTALRETDTVMISKLKSLTALVLDGCHLKEFDFLKAMKKLEGLSLRNNEITDLTPLKKFPNLVGLWLDNNQINDVLPIAKLKKLQTLTLRDNNIADVSSLAKLKAIQTIDLTGNDVSDPVALSEVRTLYDCALYDNPIDSASMPKKGLSALHFGDRATYERLDDPYVVTDPALQKVLEKSVNASQSSIFGTSKKETFTYRDIRDCAIFDAKDCGLKTMPDLSMFENIYSVDIRGNETLDLSQMAMWNIGIFSADGAQNDNLSQLFNQTNIIGVTLGDDTQPLHQDVIDWINRNAKLRWISLASSQPLDITRINLPYIKLLSASCPGSLDIASVNSLSTIEFLDLFNMEIINTEALKNAKVMSQLTLANCVCSDSFIQDIQSIKKLESLRLDNTPVPDYNALSKLKSLQHLSIHNIPLSDASFLSGMKKVYYLDLSGTGLQDLSSVYKLKKLEYLYLENNGISNVDGIEALVELRHLFVNGNRLTDLSPIYNLPKIEELVAYNNPLEDITMLKNLFPFIVLEAPDEETSDSIK